MLKRWILPEDNDKEEIAEFAAAIGVSEITAQILWHRNIKNPEKAAEFLNPTERQPFYDPFLMKDMETAVKRIKTALDKGEKIIVYGDYDVDGITATALLVKNLRRLGAKKADFYIPDRQKEGYGFNLNALNKIADEKTDLLISVDCGISSLEDVAAMKGKLDIIITDHHTPGQVLPDALAVVNPHRDDCGYPDKNLAGVGVSFKLCQALWKEIKGEDFVDDLEFVALGTVADIVPLVGENRRIVKSGLIRLGDTKNLSPGLNALLDVASLTGKVLNSGHIAFGLAPRINAAGRMGSGSDGVKLLLTDNETEAAVIARKLNDENAERQDVEKKILDCAEEKLATTDLHHSIVIDGYEWHSGVIGIVAGRLLDKYYLPTVVISRQGDNSKGSCRSIKGLNMFDALTSLKKYLTAYGGHEMAAGFTIKEKYIADFAKDFDEYANEHLQKEDYIPVVNVAAVVSPQDMSVKTVSELQALEPYGMGNPKPLFGCKNLQGKNAKVIGKKANHLTFTVGNGNKEIKMVAWNRADLARTVNSEPVDIVYVPQLNLWQGQYNLEGLVEDFAPADSGKVFPTREILADVYRFLKKISAAGDNIPFDAPTLTAMFNENRNGGEKFSLYTMTTALKIFRELKLLAAGEKNYRILPSKKTDLNNSPTFCRKI